ncbi:BT1926 family outer membrane beta-barrel protein [Marinifilum caeruleilacunae]|uniref:Outer membrane protein beta-barrel domain-containing protein n=1 Tax=Marinifilum caeruleilacunae TaxID=2499076 RepID=A0ABX1X1P0_9BACT|nr:BT1926 family outer membrane beta-barrel protein [Marinifilum caeruleilacunae]NOU62192.1 hypothetical protein [Marinifilum caeruleilacunae]
MYKKIISLISLVLLCSSALFSQHNRTEDTSNLPKKGNFTVALILGNNDVTDINPAVLPNYSVYHELNKDYVTRLGADDNFSVKEPATITNMAGLSLNYFLSDKISLSMLTSYGSKSTSGEDAFTGVIPLTDSDGNPIMGTEIPAIQGAPETKNYKFNIACGADYHFVIEQDSKLKNLDFHLGGRFNFMYERLEKKQVSWLVKNNGEFMVESGDAGTATAEALGIGGSVVAGLDYYFNKTFYLGLEVNAINLMYQHTEIVKIPGVQGADQNTTFFNAFSFPRLKIGLKIN